MQALDVHIALQKLCQHDYIEGLGETDSRLIIRSLNLWWK